MNTYGFHTIHGRGPAIVSGLRVVNPDLQVWMVTGDGDGLSIGGNHLIHILRRNVNARILLFNNEIYGLTNGQYSPTSPQGQVTKSTPMGSIDYPFNPMTLALGAGASFMARTLDRDPKHMMEVLKRASQHKGAAFVEIFQNCIVFNDGAFDGLTGKEVREEKTMKLVHGQPMIFGAKRDKGIRLKGLEPEVVSFDPANPPKDLLVHDEKAPSSTLANLLAHMSEPLPQGVLRSVERPALHELMSAQIDQAKAEKPANLQKLLTGPETWTVA
jgi:2-oxoglutarate ferredoxin oxidoreductase subunit beta